MFLISGLRQQVRNERPDLTDRGEAEQPSPWNECFIPSLLLLLLADTCGIGEDGDDMDEKPPPRTEDGDIDARPDRADRREAEQPSPRILFVTGVITSTWLGTATAEPLFSRTEPLIQSLDRLKAYCTTPRTLFVTDVITSTWLGTATAEPLFSRTGSLIQFRDRLIAY
jgi:hypothetical protein